MDETLPGRAPVIRWYRDPGTVAIGLLGCYVALYVVWRFLAYDLTGAARQINDIAFIPLYLAAFAFALAAARDTRLGQRGRLAWLLIGLSALANWCGDMLWAWYDAVLDVAPFPSWADAAYLLAYPLLLWGLYSFTARPRTAGEQLRFWLDSLTVMLAAWMVSWYFVLGPTVVEGESGRLTRLLSTAYPVGDLVVLFGILAVMLRGPEQSALRPLRILVAGTALTVVADFAFGYLSLHADSANRAWLDALWMIAPFLVALAAAAQRSTLSGWLGARSLEFGRRDLLELLPYAGIVIGYVLLLAVGFGSSDYQLAGLLTGAMLMTAIVVSRQVLALRENRRLLGRASTLAEELRQSEARFRSLVQNASDIVLVIDPDATVRYVTPSVRRVMGYPPEDVLGVNLYEAVHPDDAETLRGLVAESLTHPGVTDPAEVRMRHAEGSWCHIEALAANLLGEPSVGGIVINARDASDRKRLEEELIWQAYHDPLTGLPNRRLFLDRLEGALARSRRSGQEVALLFIDLDRFKAINDRAGHRVGDDVLVAVAQRLIGAVRPGDTVARLAGDEFTVLLEGLPGIEEATAVAARIVDAVSAPAFSGRTPALIGASVGVALTHAGQGTPDDLLRSADLAMFDAKRQGGSAYVVHDPDPGRDLPLATDRGAGTAG